jgi:hypothetical protein
MRKRDQILFGIIKKLDSDILKLVILFFLVAGCQSLRHIKGAFAMTISLDSVFINAYQFENINYPRYIFFNYQIANEAKDTVYITMRKYPFQSGRPDRAFTLFREDSLELFIGAFTRERVCIPPGKIVPVDLSLEPEQLLDTYFKYQVFYESEQAFLQDVANCGINYFEWGGYSLTSNPTKRKVVFRSPLDRAEHQWK